MERRGRGGGRDLSLATGGRGEWGGGGSWEEGKRSDQTTLALRQSDEDSNYHSLAHGSSLSFIDNILIFLIGEILFLRESSSLSCCLFFFPFSSFSSLSSHSSSPSPSPKCRTQCSHPTHHTNGLSSPPFFSVSGLIARAARSRNGDPFCHNGAKAMRSD